MYTVALDARRYDEIALFGGIGDVGENALALGGDADAMVGQAVIRSREDEHAASEIGRSEPARDHPYGQLFEFGIAFRRHHRDARTGFQQAASFSESDLAGTHYEHRPVLEIEENRVMFQPQNVARGGLAPANL